MRVAAEKDYVLDNGDSLASITDNVHGLLNNALAACGEARPVSIKIMFDMEA